jgi:endonuclease YncB( thermonuclease family)
MSHQQHIDGSTQHVAEELFLLRKLASQRRQASWQSVVEQSRRRADVPKTSSGPGDVSSNRVSRARAGDRFLLTDARAQKRQLRLAGVPRGLSQKIPARSGGVGRA